MKLKVIAHKYSAKQAVVKNFANSRDNTCTGVSFLKEQFFIEKMRMAFSDTHMIISGFLLNGICSCSEQFLKTTPKHNISSISHPKYYVKKPEAATRCVL